MTTGEHLARCVKTLNENLQNDPPPPVARAIEFADAFEAIFELIDQPWEDLAEDMKLWHQGYEQCMLDICDAIADEWGVDLPEEEE